VAGPVAGSVEIEISTAEIEVLKAQPLPGAAPGTSELYVLLHGFPDVPQEWAELIAELQSRRD